MKEQNTMGSVSYPSRHGIPVHPQELELLPPRPEPDDPSSYSIHHLLFPAKWYTGIIFGTLRDLESMQVDLPLRQHNTGKNTLHSIYGPPRKPSVNEAVGYIREAFARGERLRYGSIGDSDLKPFTERLLDQIMFEAAYEIAPKEPYEVAIARLLGSVRIARRNSYSQEEAAVAN